MTDNDEALIELLRRPAAPLQPLPTEERPRLRWLPDMRAVLFDIYGTLFVSGSGEVGTVRQATKEESLFEALRRVGLTPRPTGTPLNEYYFQSIESFHARAREAGTEYPEVSITDVWRETLGRLSAVGGLEGTLDTVDLKRLAVEYEARSNPAWPMPGARECIAALHEAGLLVGLISNAQFYTPLLFSAYWDAPPDRIGFDARLVYFSYEHRHAKPGAYLYERAADELAGRGIAAGGVLYVGNDMRNDILPASRVGFRTALFAGDRRSLRRREEDPQVGGLAPDLVVTRLSQLPDCVIP